MSWLIPAAWCGLALYCFRQARREPLPFDKGWFSGAGWMVVMLAAGDATKLIVRAVA